MNLTATDYVRRTRSTTIADRYGFVRICRRPHSRQLYSSTSFNTPYYASTVAFPYITELESVTKPLPGATAVDAEASAMGRERRVRKSINYAEPKLNMCVPSVSIPVVYLTHPQQKDAQTLSSGAHASETHGIGRLLTR